MSRPENEKNLGADISAELFDRVDDYIIKHNNPSKKQLITAMAEMWLALPKNNQAMLLHSPSEAHSIVNSEMEANSMNEQEPRTVVLQLYKAGIEEALSKPDWEAQIKAMKSQKEKDNSLLPSEKRLMLGHLDYLLYFPERAKMLAQANHAAHAVQDEIAIASEAKKRKHTPKKRKPSKSE